MRERNQLALAHFIAQMPSMFHIGREHLDIRDLRQIEAWIYATADDLLHEISREIAEIRRKDER
jgi:hypothetical protein